MFAQSTPISYHTEGLVKTEVMSTIDSIYVLRTLGLQSLNYVNTIYYVLMTLSLARPLYNGDVSLEFGYVNRRLTANVMRREQAAL